MPVDDRLPRLFDTTISSGLLIGLVAIIVVHLVMTRTAFGLKLQDRRRQPARRRSMPASSAAPDGRRLRDLGGLAGLAGAVEILGVHGNVRADWNPAYGLAVIPLVFLARFNGFAAIAFVFLFSVLSIGGESAARRLGVPNFFTLVVVVDPADHAGARRICRPPASPASRSLSDAGLLHRRLPDLCCLGAVTAGVPLLLAGLGEQISEKAGVLNIGIEGMMLVGAYCGFVGAY